VKMGRSRSEKKRRRIMAGRGGRRGKAVWWLR
jgi:hypothetical protein